MNMEAPMTCRHSSNDPNCGTYQRQVAAARQLVAINDGDTPDKDNYEVLEVEAVGPHLVLKVLYPNCAKCAFEGMKVLVFTNTTIKDALKWKTIDPHFRSQTTSSAREAPSPAARFPGSEEGWQDALGYAKSKFL
jgi:hypothetical protein